MGFRHRSPRVKEAHAAAAGDWLGFILLFVPIGPTKYVPKLIREPNSGFSLLSIHGGGGRLAPASGCGGAGYAAHPVRASRPPDTSSAGPSPGGACPRAPRPRRRHGPHGRPQEEGRSVISSSLFLTRSLVHRVLPGCGSVVCVVLFVTMMCAAGIPAR